MNNNLTFFCQVIKKERFVLYILMTLHTRTACYLISLIENMRLI